MWAGPNPAPMQALPGNGIRGGDKGIGAVVDVELGALRPFKEDVLAAFLAWSSSTETLPRNGVRCSANFCNVSVNRIKRYRVGPQSLGQQEILFLNILPQLIPEKIIIEQLADLDTLSRDLVAVTRPDAPTGGADLLALCRAASWPRSRLLWYGMIRWAFELMIKRSGGDRQAVVFKLLHLRKQNFGIDDHPVADHAFLFVRTECRTE